MPELPEVETFVRALRPLLVGRTFTGLRNSWAGHLVTPDLDEMRFRLDGRVVTAVNRRAKYLLFRLDDGQTLIVHLKMTGHLAVVPADSAADRYAHTVFELDGEAELRFSDMRKFGRVYLVADTDIVLGKLGPEPLEDAFTPAIFRKRLDGRRRVLKPLLLDQTFVAGIGNIYADEALHDAGLHPARRSHTLTTAESDALHAAIRKVLQLGIAREGASIDSYVKPDGSKGEMQNAVAVFRRTGFPCYNCGTPIERIVLGGRSTHFCPVCQPSPGPSPG